MERSLITAQHPSGYRQATRADRDGLAPADLIESTCLLTLPLEVFYRYRPTYDLRKLDPNRSADLDNESGLVIQ
jgi:hypothetical protein